MTETAQEKTSAAARSFLIYGTELSRKGRYAAAERLYQRALAIVERTLGALHAVTAEVLECYADLLAKTDRQAEATVMKHRAEAVWKAFAPRFCRSTRMSNHILCASQSKKALTEWHALEEAGIVGGGIPRKARNSFISSSRTNREGRGHVPAYSPGTLILLSLYPII